MAVWDVFDPSSGYDPTTGTAKAEFKPEQKAGLAGAKALQLGSRGEETELGEWFKKGMYGQGPSVAEEQLRRGIEAAGRGARAAGASVRGANVALAGRSASQAASRAGMEAAGQAAQLRAQEQQAYAQQYAGLVQAKRQQDLMAQGYSLEEAKAILDAETRKIEAQSRAKSEEAGRRYGLLSGILSDEMAKTDVGPYGSDEMAKTGVEPYGSGSTFKTGVQPMPAQTIGFTTPAAASPTGVQPPGQPLPPVTTGGGMTAPSMAVPGFSSGSSGPSNEEKLGTLAKIASIFSPSSDDKEKGAKEAAGGTAKSAMENSMSRLGLIGSIAGLIASSDENLKTGVQPYGSGVGFKTDKSPMGSEKSESPSIGDVLKMAGEGLVKSVSERAKKVGENIGNRDFFEGGGLTGHGGLFGMSPHVNEYGVPEVKTPFLSDEMAKTGVQPYGSGMGFKKDVNPMTTARFPDVGVPPPAPVMAYPPLRAGAPVVSPSATAQFIPNATYAYGAAVPETTPAVRPEVARTGSLGSASTWRYQERDRAAEEKAKKEKPNDLLSFLREKEATRQKERKEEMKAAEDNAKEADTWSKVGTVLTILGRAGALLAMGSDENMKSGVQPFGSGMGFKTDTMPGVGTVQSGGSTLTKMMGMEGMPGIGPVQWMGGGGGGGGEGGGGGGGGGDFLGGLGGGGGGGIPILSDRSQKEDERLAGQLEGLYAAAAVRPPPGQAVMPNVVSPYSIGRMPDVAGAPPGPPAMDPNRAMSASLAGVADLNRRLDELEKEKLGEVRTARARARRY